LIDSATGGAHKPEFTVPHHSQARRPPMQPQIQSTNRVPQADRSRGLTRLAAGLTRLPTGLSVKTHLKAGPTCTTCSPRVG
jgi:hypothetical protein